MQRRLDHAEEPEQPIMRSTLKICLAAIALAISTFSSADELGRLFFTPAQRAQLDYSFAQSAGSGGNGRALTLNGIVQQHGGKRTIWINGVPQQAGSSDDRTPESQTVRLPGKPSTVKLKVGQRVLLDTPVNPDIGKSATPDTPKQ